MQNDTTTTTISNNIIDTIGMVPDSIGAICNTYRKDDKLLSSTIYESSKHDDTFDIGSTSTDLNKPHPIFRFKFSQSFVDEMYVFSKVHQYDSRHDFKDAWNSWTEDNAELISNEIKRLENMNYQGDIMDKMFKSARYYFRKKSTIKKDPSERGIYVNLDKELLYAMDEHINRNISANIKMKPSESVKEFQQINAEYIKEKTQYLCQEEGFDESMLENKIKKTYKNRYFMIMNPASSK
jgi:hypothetical protein